MISLSLHPLVTLIQTAALGCGYHDDTDSSVTTSSTSPSSLGPCADMPVYKRSVFRQSSLKLDLVSNTTIVNPFIVPLPVCPAHSESSLAVLENSTCLFTRHQYQVLVQVVLSRLVAALTLTAKRGLGQLPHMPSSPHPNQMAMMMLALRGSSGRAIGPSHPPSCHSSWLRRNGCPWISTP